MRFRWWVLIAICLFCIGIFFGLTAAADSAGFLNEELITIEELGTVLGPFRVSTAVFIFLKNVSALLLSFIFSPVLCLLPVLALMVNGALLSFISEVILQENSLGFLLSGLLPHGIFELPALIIGGAAALSFGTAVLTVPFRRERRKLLLQNLKQSAWYLVIACILLVPAAIIETFVTPLLLT